jgi:hypothetical protein
MSYFVAVAFLNDGTRRVRSLLTYEVLHETMNEQEAFKVAESEAQRHGGTGFSWISESIDSMLAGFGPRDPSERTKPHTHLRLVR